MCQPDIPDMPEYEEPKQPPSAPAPITPQGADTLPPPMSTSAGQGDEAVIKKRKTKKELAARTKGVSRFRIPLNTGSGSGSNNKTLNIPK
jgi:hypothetical protein